MLGTSHHQDDSHDSVPLTDIKLGDFGFATSDTNSDEYKGSGAYMAPEILKKQTYDCKSADVFSLGVLFFLMVVGKYPFTSSNENDCLYRLVHLNKMELFWRTAVRNREFVKQISPEFKDLVSMMISPDALARPSMCEVKAHPWFTYSTSSEAEMHLEIESIHAKIIEKNDQFVSFH